MHVHLQESAQALFALRFAQRSGYKKLDG